MHPVMHASQAKRKAAYVTPESRKERVAAVKRHLEHAVEVLGTLSDKTLASIGRDFAIQTYGVGYLAARDYVNIAMMQIKEAHKE